MNYMNMMMNTNIALQMAEDVGTPELRNPLASGMRGHGLLSRLIIRVFGMDR